jgi:hypothetical protein
MNENLAHFTFIQYLGQLSVFYQGSNTPPLCGVRRVCEYCLVLADDTPSACGGVHSLEIGLELLSANSADFSMSITPQRLVFPLESTLYINKNRST